ncbi:MAG: hypothetical protein AAF715_20120 [Myxococcota bacterium]
MSLPPADGLVAEDASTSEPCQICSQTPHHPCDTDEIKIKVEGVTADGKAKTRELSITSSHRRHEPNDLRGQEIISLLRDDYDLVVDVIADVNADTFPSPRKPAKVEGEARYHVGQCSLQKHAEIRLRPLGGAPELDGKTEIVRSQPGSSSLTLPTTELFATTTFLDYAGPQGSSPLDEAHSLFRLISMLWDLLAGRIVELDALSCGIRPAEDTVAANLNLRAAARVFRRSKFELKIKIPPLGDYSRERAGTQSFSESTRSQSTAGRIGGTSRGRRRSRRQRDNTVIHTGTQDAGGQRAVDILTGELDEAGAFTTTGYGSGTTGGGPLTAMGSVDAGDVETALQSAGGGFDVQFTHNGKKVPNLDVIGKVKKVVNDLFEAIKNVQETINAAPQLGWKFSFKVSVLAGTIVLSWFPEYVDQPQANGRYLPVQLKIQGAFELEIFNVTVAASFGIDASAAGTGVTVKIEGTLMGSAKLSASLNLDLFTPKQVFGVSAQAGASLTVVGRATVLGKTLADAQLKGSGGIELVDGKLEVSLSPIACDLKGRIESKRVEVTGYVRSWFWKSELDPIIVMDRRELYRFT